MSAQFSFLKSERLKSRSLISELFQSNKSFYNHPIKALVKRQEVITNASIKVAVSVPKRNFKKAVDRNLLKRRILESYRLNKFRFDDQLMMQDSCLLIMFIYVAKAEESFDLIQSSLIDVIKKINKEFSA